MTEKQLPKQWAGDGNSQLAIESDYAVGGLDAASPLGGSPAPVPGVMIQIGRCVLPGEPVPLTDQEKPTGCDTRHA